ncbi:MAG: hypothetical protein HKN47_20770 [Pirellulaceae bacterium]|nr:hypothetical protein [Pirellulaceae bacterium]
MKKFALAFVAALSLTAVGMTGCGDGGETSVIEKDATATDGGLTADEQKGYEEAMKERGGPGN